MNENRYSLEYERFPAVLMHTEGFSAGCVRCCRPFYSPRRFYVIDAMRTGLLRSFLTAGANRDAVEGRQRLSAHAQLKELLEVSASRLINEEDTDSDEDQQVAVGAAGPSRGRGGRRQHALDAKVITDVHTGLRVQFEQTRMCGVNDVLEGAPMLELPQRVCWPDDTHVAQRAHASGQQQRRTWSEHSTTSVARQTEPCHDVLVGISYAALGLLGGVAIATLIVLIFKASKPMHVEVC